MKTINDVTNLIRVLNLMELTTVVTMFKSVNGLGDIINVMDVIKLSIYKFTVLHQLLVY